MKKWLITGGAGYIGSHVVRAFQQYGHECVVFDNFDSGLPQFVPSGVPVVPWSIMDRALLRRAIDQHGITGVVHLAAYKNNSLSVARPLDAYSPNVGGTLVVLEAMAEAKIKDFIFASSAAVYGRGGSLIEEWEPTTPATPYGLSKMWAERMIMDLYFQGQLNPVIFRLFNVAGGRREIYDASPFNLIPAAISAAIRERNPIIYGRSFHTKDGTAVRDYVDAGWVGEIFARAADKVERDDHSERIYNLGSGRGTSVGEIMTEIQKYAGPLTPEYRDARPGDPAHLTAQTVRLAEFGTIAIQGPSIGEIVRNSWISQNAKFSV